MASKRLVGIDELATYLGLRPRHIRALIFRKEIPYCKVGKLIRFDLERVEKWIVEKGHEP